MYENESDLSLIGQLDGNMTNLSDVNISDNSIYPPHPQPPPPPKYRLTCQTGYQHPAVYLIIII